MSADHTGRGHHLPEDWLDAAARRAVHDAERQRFFAWESVVSVLVAVGVTLAVVGSWRAGKVKPQCPAPAPAASKPAAAPTSTTACEQARRGGCRVLLTDAGEADRG